MIGKMLKTMRKKRNYTQEFVAKKIGYARNTLTEYETEAIEPTFDTIEKIANMCDFDIVFIDRKTKEILSSKNIDREEV